MDFTPIINQVISALWYLMPLAILAGLIKSPWFKGVVGEFIVNLATKLFLNSSEYHLVKDVIIPIENGTTQIDHVIVSKYGIFVIETKNLKGWIFGSQNKKYWTQKIYKHQNKFQNPLHQNYKHVKSLESLLDLGEEKFHSLVVFVGDSTFKTQMRQNVTYAGGYLKFIKSKTDVVFSDLEVNEVLERISSGKLSGSIKNKISHINHVRDIVNEKENSMSCSRCGDSMVLRVSKKGNNSGSEFWGCSKYPKCRGTVNVT